ncbi:MAG: response regulator, partial [Gammaproteobacteria bacterium]
MIRRPLYAAALAVILIFAGCCLAAIVGPLAERGGALLLLAAVVALVTAVAGAGWGLTAFIAGAACAVFLLTPAGMGSIDEPASQFLLALYALAALPVLVAVSTLRGRVAHLDHACRLREARFDAIGDGLITLDAAERVTQMNRAAERLTGWRALDARGKPLPQILRHAAPAESPTADPASPALAGGNAQERLALVASDGSERIVVPIAAPVPLPDGDGGRVILLRDATGWQTAERRLRALVDELWIANRRKDEAIAALTSGGGAKAEAAASDAAPPPEPAPAASSPPRSDAIEPDTQPYHTCVEIAPDERVLMLCDDSDSAFALSMLLGMAGYDVKTAASAPEALRQATRFAPRVALIDTTMSDTDGYAAAKALRSICAELDLVALTSPGQSPDRRALAEAGYSIAVP